MAKSSSNLPSKNIQVLGSETNHQIITSDHSDEREWLSNSVCCPIFKQFHITHTGIMKGKYPLEIVRVKQDGSFFLACLSGEGEIVIDGKWQIIKANEACLLPPLALNAIRCIEGKPWSFCWVRYNELRFRMPISSFLSSVKANFNPLPLKSAISGLHSECLADNQLSQLNLWTEIIHQYVLKFTKKDNVDERLWKLWKVVEADLGKDWNLTELAALATVSEEHLRRLCNKQLGRSPMQQLTYFRMQKARFLLGTTNEKVETISAKLGYANPFTFSNTFKKWVGCRPSEVR